jgi:hypothetical protein
MTFWTKNKLLYLLQSDPGFQYLKLKYKFHRIEVQERAYRRNSFSKMVNVPIEITSKNSRSRVRNKEIASRIFLNIEQFNEHYGLDVKLEDLPIKY